MSGASITGVFETSELRAAIADWRATGRNSRPLLRAIGTRLVSNTQDRFNAEQDPEGRRWAPLSPGYAGIKRGAGILREAGVRGGLQASITHDVADGEVAIGSNKIYAAIHQFGGIIRPKNGPFLKFRTVSGFAMVRSVTIPARPYLGLSRGDEEDILDIVQHFLLRR